MSEFVPINTQEEFDAAISERLNRERETVKKRYGDYDDLKTKTAEQEETIKKLNKAIEDSAKEKAGRDKQVLELEEKVRGYETSSVKMRIARETGIPYELAEKLSGETEEDIRKDAKIMSGFIKGHREAPLKSTESGGSDKKTAAYKELLGSMKGE